MKWFDWIALFLLVAGLTIGTYERNRVWFSEISLWKDCVAKSPNKDRPHLNLGSALLREHQINEAQIQFKRAIELSLITNEPRYLKEAYTNIGITYGEQKNYPQAFDYFDKALRHSWYPDSFESLLNAKIYNNYGLYKYYAKDYDGAIKYFQESFKRNPDSDLARNNFRVVVEARMKKELAK